MRIFKQSPNFWRKSGTNLSPIDLTTNVGIGITTPTEKLDVVGNSTFSGSITSTSATAGQSLITQGLIVNNGGGATTSDDFQVKGDTDNNLIYADASADNVGIGTASPTARLHLAAGTATANTAPLKFTAGTALTTPETGVLEFHNDRLYVTNVANRRAIDRTSGVITSTTTVANTVTETTLFTGTLEADALKAGNVIKINTNGVFSTANAADSITVRVKLGTTTIGTITLSPKVYTNEHWDLYALLTVRSIGATGTVSVHGDLDLGDDSAKSITEAQVIDTTSSEDITVTAQWDNALAGNTISIYQGLIEFKN